MRVSSREFDMRALFGLIVNVNKDSSLKAKARTKDSSFVHNDNQGPRPRTTSLMASDASTQYADKRPDTPYLRYPRLQYT